ncbi:MAG TPA: hypothetical protein VGF77_11330 [Allosphingosinicella sp.]
MDPPPPLEIVPESPISFAASAALVGTTRPHWWASLAEGILFGLILIAASALLAGRNGLIGAFLGYVFTWTWLCLIRSVRVRHRLRAMWNVPPYLLSLDDCGVTAASESGSVRRAWSRATNLIERPEWVAIVFDGLEVLAVPASSFPSAEAREDWLRYARAYASRR